MHSLGHCAWMIDISPNPARHPCVTQCPTWAVISSYAECRNDKTRPQGLTASTTKQGLLCILTTGGLRSWVFAETADDWACSPCPYAQTRQDRLNCLISKKGQ